MFSNKTLFTYFFATLTPTPNLISGIQTQPESRNISTAIVDCAMRVGKGSDPAISLR